MGIGTLCSLQINSFCGCFGLEFGTKCIGIMHLLSAIGLVILTSCLAVDASSQINTIDDLVDGTYAQAYQGLCIVAGLGSLHIILAAVLLVGAYKRKTCLLRVWVWTMVLLLAGAILFIIAVKSMYGARDGVAESFLAVLEGVIFFGFVGHAILCVNSFYLMLKSDEDMCGPQSNQG